MKQGRILIVIAVMILAPHLSQADEKSDVRVSIAQLRHLVRHVAEFSAAHEGRLPKTFGELLGEKVADKKLLVSPLAKDQTAPSYELLTPAEKYSGIQNPTKSVVIRSLFRTKDGMRLAAFADGHVQYLSE